MFEQMNTDNRLAKFQQGPCLYVSSLAVWKKNTFYFQICTTSQNCNIIFNLRAIKFTSVSKCSTYLQAEHCIADLNKSA